MQWYTLFGESLFFYKMMVYLILCSLPLQYLRFFQLKRWPETYHRMHVDKQYTRYSNQKQLLLYVLGRYFTCFITVKGGLIVCYNIIEDVQKKIFLFTYKHNFAQN